MDLSGSYYPTGPSHVRNTNYKPSVHEMKFRIWKNSLHVISEIHCWRRLLYLAQTARTLPHLVLQEYPACNRVGYVVCTLRIFSFSHGVIVSKLLLQLLRGCIGRFFVTVGLSTNGHLILSLALKEKHGSSLSEIRALGNNIWIERRKNSS